MSFKFFCYSSFKTFVVLTPRKNRQGPGGNQKSQAFGNWNKILSDIIDDSNQWPFEISRHLTYFSYPDHQTMKSAGGGGSCVRMQLCTFVWFIPTGITFTTPSTATAAAAAIEKYIEFHMRIDSNFFFSLNILIIFECNCKRILRRLEISVAQIVNFSLIYMHTHYNLWINFSMKFFCVQFEGKEIQLTPSLDRRKAEVHAEFYILLNVRLHRFSINFPIVSPPLHVLILF